MGKVPPTIGLVVVGLLMGGCATGAAGRRASEAAPPAAPAASAAKTASGPATASAPAGQLDPQALQQIMAEVQQLGAMDPAARDRLMADLRQTDQALWPDMLRVARAGVAFRKQAQQREMAQPDQNRMPLGTDGGQPIRQPSQPDSMPIMPQPSSAQAPPPAVAQAPMRLGQAAPPSAPRRGSPAPGHPISKTLRSADPDEGLSSPVVQAAYNSPPGDDWQMALAAAVQAVESQSKNTPKSEAEIAQQARLRMLYLLAGRREDAMRPLTGSPPAVQDYWSKQLFALTTWLDTERTPDATRRAAETKQILSEASARLGEAAPLVVRNLAFCTAVQSYGAITPFKKNEFAPNQEVLLYAEAENYKSESTPKGFHTSLRTSYQIFDSGGRRVADHEFAPIEDYCQSPRRDFFIGYHLRMPKRIYPGKHTLQLTIVDQKSQKVGQSSIELTIKGDE